MAEDWRSASKTKSKMKRSSYRGAKTETKNEQTESQIEQTESSPFAKLHRFNRHTAMHIHPRPPVQEYSDSDDHRGYRGRGRGNGYRGRGRGRGPGRLADIQLNQHQEQTIARLNEEQLTLTTQNLALTQQLSQIKLTLNKEIRSNARKSKDIQSKQSIIKQLKQEITSFKQSLKDTTTLLKKEQSTLKTQNTRLTQQLSEINSTLNKERSSNANKNNEIESKEGRIKQLTQEVASLKQSLQKYPKHKAIYSIHPITKEATLKGTLIEINKNINFNNYNETFTNQQNIMNEWNKTTKKVQNIEHQIQKTNHINITHNKDDRKPDNTANDLLKSYISCNKLIQQQSKRLYTDDHILQLFKKKNSICDHLDEHEKKTSSYSAQNDNVKSEYVATQISRKALIETVDVKVKECNNIIQKENEFFHKVEQTNHMLQLLNQQKKQLSDAANVCEALIQGYTTFRTINDDGIDVIQKHFKNQWVEFESKWVKWEIVDIISWFKYKTIERDTYNVDWNNVEIQMKKRNINGASLEDFVITTLDLIGFVDFSIASLLMKKITLLIAKYPVHSYNEIEGKENGSHEAPKEFYCKLTKRIMNDPVVAFDGNVYERTAIQKYLEQNGVSPETKKKASTLTLWPVKGLKLRICEYQRNTKGGTETDHIF